MAVFAAEHTARKTYDCATCTGQIRPGEKYLRTAVSPHDESYDNTGQWVTYITHTTPQICTYVDSLLKPGERNPCALDEVDGDIAYCACGDTFRVPADDGEGAAITAAFKTHVASVKAGVETRP